MDTMKSWKVEGFGIGIAFGGVSNINNGMSKKKKKVNIPKRGTFLLKAIL